MRRLAPKPGPPENRQLFKKELSDVLIYLVTFTARCHVDLPQAVPSKMDINRRALPSIIHLSPEATFEDQA